MSTELPDYEAATLDNELYWKAWQVKFYADRMTNNLLNVKNSPSVQKITVINPNLYDLAAKFYNDADQWTVIAEANGFDTPFLDGTFLLLIPNNPPISTGGIINV